MHEQILRCDNNGADVWNAKECHAFVPPYESNVGMIISDTGVIAQTYIATTKVA